MKEQLMKAAVFTGLNRIEMQEVPQPKPKPDEVLIRVRAAGVCGSEVHAFIGTHPFRKPPAIMGHEVSGDVVEVGSEVRGISIGDRVIVNPQKLCGDCFYCRSGNSHLCLQKTMMGTPDWTGAFAEYVTAHESCTIKMPDSFSYEEGVMCEPLSVGIHSAKKARVALGDTVLVLGSGAIGLCCIAAAKAAGATKILATDAYDYNLELARKAGAETVFNVRSNGSLGETVAESLRPEGADVVMVTAGFDPVVAQALVHVRKLGRVALVALFDGALTIKEPFHIGLKELEVIGVHTYEHQDFYTAIDLIQRGTVDVKSMVSHVLPVEEAQRALELVYNKTENNAKVILTFN
jgi:L-iditol 2-dehydrogenase